VVAAGRAMVAVLGAELRQNAPQGLDAGRQRIAIIFDRVCKQLSAGAAAQAIGEGRFDFGMCTPSIAILQTIRGLPTVALAACAYDATVGIGVLNGLRPAVSGPGTAKPARVAGTSLATVMGRRKSSSTGGYVGAAMVSRVHRNGTAEAIEAVSALDNVLYPIRVLTRCSAQRSSPMC
jgi:hypothetical protein